MPTALCSVRSATGKLYASVRRHTPALLDGLLRALCLLAGFAAIAATLWVEGKTYGAAPDFAGPQTCTATPRACWDRLAKSGGIKCPHMYRDVTIRGHVVKAGEKTCYKAVYWNAERATVAVLLWFLAWAALIMRAYERLASRLFAGGLRWSAALAVLAAQPSLWYGFIVMIQYTNDFWYNYYSSQLYFTATEAFVFGVMIFCLDRAALPPPPVWYAAAGTAAYHVLQLLLDEAANALRGQGLGRTVHMLAGDGASLCALVAMGAEVHKGARAKRVAIWVAVVVFAEWLLFNAAFGDAASSGLSSRIQLEKDVSGEVHHSLR